MNTVAGSVYWTNGTLGVQLPGGRVELGSAAGEAVRQRGRDDLVVGVRPEHAVLDPEGAVEAVVAVTEVLGHEQHVICRLADGSLFTVRQPNDASPPGTGVEVRIRIDPARVHAFDPQSGLRLDASTAAAPGDGADEAEPPPPADSEAAT